MKIRIKRLHPRARVPVYSSDGAACFDLFAVIDDDLATVSDPYGRNGSEVLPGKVEAVRTGLAFEIPQGFVMNLYSRSGHGAKFGATLANSVGKIDSDYRGEVVILLATHCFPMIVLDGDRIAQAEIVPIERVELFDVVESLTGTERGAGGFGSTGK